MTRRAVWWLFSFVLLFACHGGDPGSDKGGVTATTPDADEDCFDPACWTDPWGLFEPQPPGETRVDVDVAIPIDAGATDAVLADAYTTDAELVDATMPGDGPMPDAACADQPEPACPQPPAGGYQPQNPGIPGGGLCRGACGPACPATCVAAPAATECVSWQTKDCKQHKKVCTYGVLSCGTHAGCRVHDACYDGCAGLRGLAYQACRRGCDVACIRANGVKKCSAWMRGKGPFDGFISFTAAPTSVTMDGACP